MCGAFSYAQDFDFTITDGNMTVQVGADVCSSVMDQGDLLGAFFTNDAGELQNAGFLTFEGDQLAIAVWADDSQTADKDGFSAGESIQWAMYDQSGSTTVLLDAEMASNAPFSTTFVSNGFGQVTSLSVAAAGGGCEDLDDSVLAPFGCEDAITFFTCDGSWNGLNISDVCLSSCDNCPSCEDDDSGLAPFSCTDAITFFTCDGSWNGLNISDVCEESCGGCVTGPVLGCMDSGALNYDDSATEDDGSCTYPVPGPMDYVVTDGNMTVQVGADVVLINGSTPPVGSLLGAYYSNPNDASELLNAGYMEWTGDQLAIAVWADDSQTANQDGFTAGETITWVLQVGR